MLQIKILTSCLAVDFIEARSLQKISLEVMMIYAS
jgi:hypothetical protein